MNAMPRQRLRTTPPRRRPLALALTAALAMPILPAAAQSLPEYGNVVRGDATIGEVTGNQMTITQGSKGAVINWGTFNVAEGYRLTFDQQQGADSVTLNRVVGWGYGASPSFIDGSMVANGNVFVINPAGITFGTRAQVSVGGLVASTIDIANDDFMAGTASGQYRFMPAQLTDTDDDGIGDTLAAAAVVNDGTIVTRPGGTVALLGATAGNSGAIDAAGGSVLFGSGENITLDFHGDGLTQITVGGGGLKEARLVCPGSFCYTEFVDGSVINAGTVSADGGQILMRASPTPGSSQAAVVNAGILRARSLVSRAGRIELSSPGGAVTLGSRDETRLTAGLGSIDVSGVGGAAGGSVQVTGASFSILNGHYSDGSSWIDASGSSGGNVTIETSGDVYTTWLSRIVANGYAGPGGNVRLLAGGSVSLYGTGLAVSSTDGPGGEVVVDAAAGDVAVLDSHIAADGGERGGSVMLAARHGGVEISGRSGGSHVTADGGIGGQVDVVGTAVLMDGDSHISASGTSGAGGRVGLDASQALAAFGVLAARGRTSGGAVTTRTGETFDIRGLSVEAGADTGASGQWTLIAPDLDVIEGSAVGSAYDPSYDVNVQDGEINRALAAGSNVTLQARNGQAGAGNVNIGPGVRIGHDGALLAQTFQIDADGSISGKGFRIGSANTALGMVFNANASGTRPDAGTISFADAQLDSGGGDILMYGASDPATGRASGRAGGISLSDVQVATAGGAVLMRGSETGAGGAGVSLTGTQIAAGTGSVHLDGTGTSGSGVHVDGGAISGGMLDLRGTGGSNGDGLRISGASLASSGGTLSLDGRGGLSGVTIDGASTLATDGGALQVRGSGGAGNGVDMEGDVSSTGGDIAIVGSSAQAQGLRYAAGSGVGLASGGGSIMLEGSGATGGVLVLGSGGHAIDSAGGTLTVLGEASGSAGIGVSLRGIDLRSGSGNLDVTGNAPSGVGIAFEDAGVHTTSGAIGLHGVGSTVGLDLGAGTLDTVSGNLLLEGRAASASAIAGVRIGGGGLATDGGSIDIRGEAAGGAGVQLGNGSDPFAIRTGGGALAIAGTGTTDGVVMRGNVLDSQGGDVSITGEGARGVLLTGGSVATGDGALRVRGDGATLGISLQGARIDAGAGDVDIAGSAAAAGGLGVDLGDARVLASTGAVAIKGIGAQGVGMRFGGASDIRTTSGAITLTAIGLDSGLQIDGGTFQTESGHIDLRGRAEAGGADGLLIGAGVQVTTNGGGIALSGQAGTGAGLVIGTGAVVEAGDSLVVIRAGNDGSSDAIRIGGAIRSGVGVNLRPGGVDPNGGVYDRVDDGIVVGTGTGFALDDAELDRISAPELVIGSAQHAGGIRVEQAQTRAGNLTLQNQGGAGGIDLGAGIDVGGNTLALASGGSVVQTAGAPLLAHSLLVQAGGDVLLGAAGNDVASTTLAGSAGGRFEFNDATDLSIGTVHASGMDASADALAGLSVSGIQAGGDVLVRNRAGDLTLDAGVSGANVDLVTAGRLQNAASAAIAATGRWRVWASTWQGEARGGLAGSGPLPNLYGCAFDGPCGVTVSSGDNHFIYEQQPVATITFDNASREYGLANPVFTWHASGAILGDSAANAASGSAGTTATIGSDVGLYPISGMFTSAAGYAINIVPGTLAITPATLLLTADPFVRYLGSPNPEFTGTVAGFRNGDTVASVFGAGPIWRTPAGPLSPVGYYAVNGGTSAKNYVFAQAPGNATALQVIPLPQLAATPVEFLRETVDTYVYDRNFGAAPVCAMNASLDEPMLAGAGDPLANEWSKVRSRPNLTNCFDSERRSACGDF